MPTHLTDLSIQHLKAEPKQRIVWDSITSGFGIRISPAGKKSFIVQTGDRLKRTKQTIGVYPDLALKDARIKAKRLVADSKTGERVSHRTAFRTSLKPFYEAMQGRVKKATLEQYKSYLDAFDFKVPLGQITKADINEQLHQWAGKVWSQNYAYASLRVFLNWCLEQEYIDKHPLIHGRAPNRVRSRDRVLTDTELGKIWRCSGDDHYGHIMRLLILTGQRRMEVTNLKPADIADGLITFHTKGDKINVLPLTPLVEQNLKQLPFKFNNWGNAKARFDTDCGVEFRHHDLRRTLATKLAGMGVQPVVVERILGHTIPGVAGIYNRHTYLPEVQQALLTWESHIRKIASLAQLTDTNAMVATYKATDNNYAKLQLFRIINGENHDNDVVKNYVNKTFHIDNEYVVQLNPHKYDFVPEHIIAECDQFLNI